MNLPAALINSLRDIKGFNEEAFKEVHTSGGQITSIRLNPEKFKRALKVSPPAGGGDLEGAVPWSSKGYYLSKRPSFTLDPLFHAGAYYVQEASSMFLEEALKQTVDLSKPLKVLDLCAAPGGKSTLIQSIISKDSLLVSNEVIKTRVNILAENMTKWGAANVIVTNNDPKDFQRLQNYFDVIVVDAPCSGSGLFRKDPNAINEWSENNVALCAQRQQRILADILPSLKEGGTLIYSTCSYSQQEDEAISDWLVGELKVESMELKIDKDWGIVETVSAKANALGYRFYPNRVKGEGFFIAAFRKRVSGADRLNEFKNQKSKIKKGAGVSAKEIEILEPYLADPNAFFFIKQNEETIAVPKHFEEDLEKIKAALYIKKAGVTLGTLIRQELIPAHDLAISNIINHALPKLEVDKETALQYLRKEEVIIDTAIKGWVLLTYGQSAGCYALPIGWVKVMANRINNYYPKEWRILNK